MMIYFFSIFLFLSICLHGAAYRLTTQRKNVGRLLDQLELWEILVQLISKVFWSEIDYFVFMIINSRRFGEKYVGKKCFRGRKAVEAERLSVRRQFFMTYGKHCPKVDRVKQLAYVCIRAVHHNRQMFCLGGFHVLMVHLMKGCMIKRTELVPVLWNFMKRCHESQKWSALSGQLTYLPGGAPGWLSPLSVFCPVYKHMLMLVDNEEFYEQEKPLPLKDISCLIVILRQLLWVNPVTPPNLARSTAGVFALKRHPQDFFQHRISIVDSDLLSQLQDWNRRQFTLPGDFHTDGVNDHFISRAMIENSRAHEILKMLHSWCHLQAELKYLLKHRITYSNPILDQEWYMNNISCILISSELFLLRYNYLNDLPSLDPELYHHLIFLKRYEGDSSELELYFVIVNNEYGEKTQEELLPRGKNIRVTNKNVIMFFHLRATH
ncbi:E3 ubiquitin-protein ligase UPL6-like [Actinidia eriantha]|uniref:E3 ubiquitin-protein ligase UPL6-like n=1 Tax=Actinidia eriantha TaxID=165200 RepID=UPI00258AA961|nr:E3 ubiquitin-protein ligase UPL6-like [Actinidia eriantha]